MKLMPSLGLLLSSNAILPIQPDIPDPFKPSYC